MAGAMALKLLIALGVLNLYGVGFLVWKNVRHREPTLATKPEPTTTHTYDCRLVRVIDANTVEVDIDLGFDTWLHGHRFELLDVDLRDTSREKAKDLTAELERLLAGRSLTIQSVQNRKDSFDRWLALLYADGQCVNDRLRSLMTLDE